MKISEYQARVKKLRVALPDLEAEFNWDEGLTLVAHIGGERVVFTGEPEIIEQMEEAARKWLARVSASLGVP